jgi:hypothetical protein
MAAILENGCTDWLGAESHLTTMKRLKVKEYGGNFNKKSNRS